MKKLNKFKEENQKYYIAGLQHSPNTVYTLACERNASNRLLELDLTPNHNLHNFIAILQYSAASVHTSIQNVLNSSHGVLTGEYGNVNSRKRTIILSSSKPDFSEDVQVEVECLSTVIIEECKQLGIWEN